MFDELDRLTGAEPLFLLLSHYAVSGMVDREVWQDRRANLEGVAREDLVRFHGELLAFDWIEQNTGVTPPGVPGTTAQCYRVTPSGLRAFKQARSIRRREEMPDDVAA